MKQPLNAAIYVPMNTDINNLLNGTVAKTENKPKQKWIKKN